MLQNKVKGRQYLLPAGPRDQPLMHTAYKPVLPSYLDHPTLGLGVNHGRVEQEGAKPDYASPG